MIKRYYGIGLLLYFSFFYVFVLFCYDDFGRFEYCLFQGFFFFWYYVVGKFGYFYGLYFKDVVILNYYVFFLWGLLNWEKNWLKNYEIIYLNKKNIECYVKFIFFLQFKIFFINEKKNQGNSYFWINEDFLKQI